MLYISLAVCNIEPLIEGVLEKLYTNTKGQFYLSVVDNASKDKTVDVIKGVLSGWGPKCEDCNISKIADRESSTVAINLSFKPLFDDLKGFEDITQVTKLDHDYGVPENWDVVMQDVFNKRPDIHLLCPSVLPETPKGMQYYSQGHEPELITKAGDHTLYHYTGIAGYAHTWTYLDFLQLASSWNRVYRPLNTGAVFGSEDADMSLRCINRWGKNSNAYIFDSQGWHWDKPIIGKYEEQWKSEATFKKTLMHWEEWAELNVPRS